MIRLLYNIAFSLFTLCFIPDFLFKKKYRKSLLKRLFPRVPQTGGKKVIWLHAVSVGEVKALATLVPPIRKSHPDAFILITTITETGYAEAARSVPEAHALHYLPFDLSWIIRPFVHALAPSLLILVEGDYWLNLIAAAKKEGCTIVVASGKLSEKSLRRYRFFSPLKQLLFTPIDHFFLQDESYQRRFLDLGIPPEKLTITGNLKFDSASSKSVDLSLFPEGKVITLGSTHEGEEALLLKALLPLLRKNPQLKLLIVPRHPERFEKVKAMIEHPQVTVIDQMGVLSSCYARSLLAIVGGSFVKGVGGHDIFEPVKMGVPTLFGPHMEAQTALTTLITQAGAGIKLSIEELPKVVEKLLNSTSQHAIMSQKGKKCAESMQGVSQRTWNSIRSVLLRQ